MNIDVLKEAFLKWIMKRNNGNYINSNKGLRFLISHCSCIDVNYENDFADEFFVLTTPSDADYHDIKFAYNCIGYLQDFIVQENILIDLDTGKETTDLKGDFVTSHLEIFDFRPILPEFIESILKRVNPYTFEKFLMENI